MVSLLIPLMIAGGFDGVEPLRDSATPRETLAAQPRQKVRRMSYRAASKVLGVDVGHLWRVVHGERVSKRLCARLRAANIELEVK